MKVAISIMLVLLVLCIAWTGQATEQLQVNGWLGKDVVSAKRSLLQGETLEDLIRRNDVEVVPSMLQAIAGDPDSAVKVAELLPIIDEDAEKAYIFSDNFGRAAELGEEVAAFLGQVVLAAESIAPQQMAQVIVAAVSQGEQQTQGMVDILAATAEAGGCEGFETIIAETYDFAQSQGKTRDIAETFAQSGSAAECALCEDYIPTDDATCEERKGWGECEAEWMIFGYFCAPTCGYCREGTAPKQRKPRNTVVEEETITDQADEPIPVTRSAAVSRVQGPTVTDSLEQAIASGATQIAASNLLNFVQDGSVNEVAEGIVSIVAEYTTATTLTLALALRSVKPENQEALFVVLRALLPDYPEVVANALQQASRRTSGVAASGDFLIEILSSNDGQFPSLVQAAAANCKGIPPLVQYVVDTDEQLIAAFVQDNDAILLCLAESEQVASALSTVPAVVEPIVQPTEEVEADTPAAISDDNALGDIAVTGFDEAVTTLVDASILAIEQGDTSIFTSSLEELIAQGLEQQVTLTIAAAFMGTLSPEQEQALALGLSEWVAFSGQDVAPLVAAALSIVQLDVGCEAVNLPIKVISDKASVENRTEIWGAALSQHTNIVTECLGDDIRFCSGFAQRDCCDQDPKPERCNFCGFQFNKECRYELERFSIPSVGFYVYRDKRFNNILCKCPMLITA